jgi:hypothetical protein
MKKKRLAANKPKKASTEEQLKDQYYVIRDDLLRLKTDLAKGYDLAKDWVDSKPMIKKVLRS